jgi:hypothetical protein
MPNIQNPELRRFTRRAFNQKDDAVAYIFPQWVTRKSSDQIFSMSEILTTNELPCCFILLLGAEIKLEKTIF